jgi:outer membrane protein W
VKRALLAGLAIAFAWSTPAEAAPRKQAPQRHPKKKKLAPVVEEPAPDPAIELDPAPAPAKPVDEPVPVAPAAAVDEPAPAPAPRPKRSKKRFYVRAGVAIVKPLASSRELELADIDGAASLAVMNGPIAGSGATVSSATIPALILGYELPMFDGKIAIETVLGVPFTVKFESTGTLANESIAPTALGIPTGVQALGPELGEAKAAPPLVTAVYRFNHENAVQPFVGAGLAVLFAYGAHVTNPMLTEVSKPEFSIAPAPGLVLQSGIEARFAGSFYARLDVKFIAFMMARGEVHHIQVRTPDLPLFDTVEVGTAKMNVWVNPLIIQAGIGVDF